MIFMYPNINGGNGVGLNFQGLAATTDNQDYVWYPPNSTQVYNEGAVSVEQQLTYSGRFFQGIMAVGPDDTSIAVSAFKKGMKMCISSPMLSSAVYDSDGIIKPSDNDVALTDTQTSKVVTFACGQALGPVSDHVIASGVPSTAMATHFAGAMGMSHFFTRFSIYGTFYTRYLKSGHANVSQTAMDDLVEKDMSTWIDGLSYRIVLVQQYKTAYGEADLVESDIYDALFPTNQFYRPGNIRVKATEKNHSTLTKADLQTEDQTTNRTKRFHIIKTFTFRHGNVATDVRDLNNWTTPVKINWKVPMKYQKVKYMFTSARTSKQIQNPIFCFIQTDSNGLDDPEADGSLAGSPIAFFRGDIRAYHEDQIPQSAFH